MWERFTERAKHVVSAAREEATRLGSEYVRTEHILLGLCREPDGIAARALRTRRQPRRVVAGDRAPDSEGQRGCIHEGLPSPPREEGPRIMVEGPPVQSQLHRPAYFAGAGEGRRGDRGEVLQDMKIDLVAEVIRLLGDSSKPSQQASTSRRDPAII